MLMPSAINIDELFTRGGEKRIAFLRFCVMSVTMEPIFVFLTGEYRLRPTHAAALALYEVFCAPDAPARIRALHLLPPRDLRLLSATQSIRLQWAQMQSSEQTEEGSTAGIITPHKNLFDFVVNALRLDPQGRFMEVSNRYNPQLTPQQNLPGGKMNAAQRHFLENIWQPIARPRLVAAGFWRIADIA
jgi:hypothetical protein